MQRNVTRIALTAAVVLKVALIEAHPNHDKFRMLQMRKLRETHIQDPREFFTLSPVLQPIGHAIAIAR
jgi:hypothetical protein